MVRELTILEPYGEGFPQPLFGLVADVRDVRFMGAEKQHVKYMDSTGLSIIQWNQGEKARSRTHNSTSGTEISAYSSSQQVDEESLPD